MKYMTPTQLKLAIVAIGVVGIITPMTSAMATTQILRQTIHADSRCSHTTIAAAEHAANAADCEVFSPSVASVVIDDNGVLMARGVYDAVHDNGSLIIRFNGHDYGVRSSELTTKGNLWELSLDTKQLSPRLQGGKEYTGEVSMTTVSPHGAAAQHTIAFTVTAPITTTPEASPQPGVATPSQSLPQRIITALADTGQSIGLIIAAAAMMIIAAGWLVIWRRKRRRKEGG